MTLTHAQLAEILESIARTHAAVINAALDKETVMKQVIPTLQGRSGVTRHAELSLQTVYPRLLLQSFAAPSPGKPPLHEFYAKELEKLIPNP